MDSKTFNLSVKEVKKLFPFNVVKQSLKEKKVWILGTHATDKQISVIEDLYPNCAVWNNVNHHTLDKNLLICF